MNKDQLNRMTVAQLRDYARDNRHLHSMTGVQIISLPKAELIYNLVTDETPHESLERLKNSANLSDHMTPLPSGATVDTTNDNLADAIAKALEGRVTGTLNEDAVQMLLSERLENYSDHEQLSDHFMTNNSILKEEIDIRIDTAHLSVLRDVDAMIQDAVQKYQPQVTTIEVYNKDKDETVHVGLAHARFEKVLQKARKRIPVWMVGESGSGKSHIAMQIAKALGLNFFPLPVTNQTTKSDLMGFIDSKGREVRTALWDAYEFGGVFMLDEADGGNANVLMALNAMLSNGWAMFAGRVLVEMHPDFICLAGANTYGKGADMIFVGRLKLDGATLNRFCFLETNIDEDLETALVQRSGIEGAMDWCRRVQKIRKAVRDLGEKVIVSPRASLMGMVCLDDDTWEELEDQHIFQGANTEVKNRILERARS